MQTQPDDIRHHIIQILLFRLYNEHLNYWNKQLTHLKFKNTRAHGRNPFGSTHYSIFFDNKVWVGLTLNRENQEEDTVPLPLHPDFPHFKTQMTDIADELGELEAEKYEVDRFLSNLLTFSFTLPVMNDILGDTLYETAKAAFERNKLEFERHWCNAAKVSLATFVTENQPSLRKLTQRLMINLITLDGTKQI